MLTREKDILFVSEELPYEGWMEKMLEAYPAENAGWSIFNKNGETSLIWDIDDNLLKNREMPCYSERDPWNRKIRKWVLNEEDTPSVWLSIDDMHRQSFEVPKNAIQYAWTSIEGRCFCLYLIQ